MRPVSPRGHALVELAFPDALPFSQAYITNLNIALEKQDAAEAKGDVAGLISLQGALKFNGGGHVNHSIFWTNLAPASKGGGGEPEGELATYINKSFGSFEVRA
jgi:Fe-Mn family superoxide dismutase